MFFKTLRLILGIGWLAAPVSAARFSTFQSGGPFGGQILALTYQPGNSSIVLAGSGNNGVFRSTDGGATWSTTNSNRYFEFCQGVVFDPTNPSTAYAGGGNGGGGFNFERSTDGGQTWNVRGTTLASNVRSLVIDPVHTTNLLAGTDDGIYRTTDAGATWANSSSGLPDGQTPSLSMDPANPSIAIVALRLGSVFRTTDGGSTWKPVDGMPSDPQITGLAFDPTGSGRAFAGAEDALYRSTDHGVTWQKLPTSGFSYQAYSYGFVQPSTIFAATGQYLEKSTDRGLTWSSLASRFFIRDVFVRTVAIDPTNSSRMLIGTYGSGVVRSTDGGNHWTPGSAGLVNNAEVDALALDPGNPATVIAGSRLTGAWRTVTGGLTWAAMDTFYFADSVVFAPLTPPRLLAGQFDVSFSTDGGATWTDPNQNIGHETRALAVSPANPHWVYAGTTGNGVWRSSNGGNSWAVFSTGLPMTQGEIAVVAVAGDFGSDQVAYAAVYTDSGVSVLKTTDAGGHWADSGTGLPANSINSLTADPGAAGVIYAATGNGLYKTIDGGAHWVVSNGAGANFADGVNAVAIAPANRNIIFAGTNGHGVFQSTDGGGHWTDISAGLPGLSFGLYVNALISDATGTRVYAGSDAGVYQMTPAPLVGISSHGPAQIGNRSGH